MVGQDVAIYKVTCQDFGTLPAIKMAHEAMVKAIDAFEAEHEGDKSEDARIARNLLVSWNTQLYVTHCLIERGLGDVKPAKLDPEARRML